MEFITTPQSFAIVHRTTVTARMAGNYTDRNGVVTPATSVQVNDPTLSVKVVSGDDSITTTIAILTDLAALGQVTYVGHNVKVQTNRRLDLRAARLDAEEEITVRVFGRPGNSRVVRYVPLTIYMILKVSLCLDVTLFTWVWLMLSGNAPQHVLDAWRTTRYDLCVTHDFACVSDFELIFSMFGQLAVVITAISLILLSRHFFRWSTFPRYYDTDTPAPTDWRPIGPEVLNQVVIDFCQVNGYTHYYEIETTHAIRDLLLREYNNWALTMPSSATVSRGIQNHAVTAHLRVRAREDLAEYIIQYIALRRHELTLTRGSFLPGTDRVTWG